MASELAGLFKKHV